MGINLNELAKRITLREGLKDPEKIGNVKEILRLALEELAKEDSIDVLQVLKRFKK